MSEFSASRSARTISFVTDTPRRGSSGTPFRIFTAGFAASSWGSKVVLINPASRRQREMSRRQALRHQPANVLQIPPHILLHGFGRRVRLQVRETLESNVGDRLHHCRKIDLA